MGRVAEFNSLYIYYLHTGHTGDVCWSQRTITAEAWRCSAQVKESHFGPPAPLQPLQPRRDQSGGPQIMAAQLSDQSITLVINIGKNICICIPRGNDIIIIKHN